VVAKAEVSMEAKHTPGPWKNDNENGCRSIKGGKSARHQQAQYKQIAGSGSVSNGGPRDLDIHMQAVPGRWGDTGRDGVK
jgi:hypothetical protein